MQTVLLGVVVALAIYLAARWISATMFVIEREYIKRIVRKLRRLRQMTPRDVWEQQCKRLRRRIQTAQKMLDLLSDDNVGYAFSMVAPGACGLHDDLAARQSYIEELSLAFGRLATLREREKRLWALESHPRTVQRRLIAKIEAKLERARWRENFSHGIAKALHSRRANRLSVL